MNKMKKKRKQQKKEKQIKVKIKGEGIKRKKKDNKELRVCFGQERSHNIYPYTKTSYKVEEPKILAIQSRYKNYRFK